jgi:hypothetical protein
MAPSSPLVQLLEGIHCQQRDRVDNAMKQIRILLAPLASNDLVLDGTSKTLSEVVRLVLSRHPELACAVNPKDGSLPLHHAASLGDIAITELLLATVRELAQTRVSRARAHTVVVS